MFKKILIVLVLFSVIVPLTTRAENNSQSIEELQRKINELTQLIEKLRGNTDTGATRWCYTFNRNMGVDASGRDVRELYTALGKEGFLVATDQSNYGTERYTEATAATVSQLQEKYRRDILTPNGLSAPTGYVGPATRGKLNSLYGCSGQKPIVIKPLRYGCYPQYAGGPTICVDPPPPTPGNLPPSISGVSGPTTLGVGQVGTWSVQASDPENGPLSYSVAWGDEGMMASGSYSPTISKQEISQTSTFTHSYAQAYTQTQNSTYYPMFSVTDNSGQSAQTSISVNVGNGNGCENGSTYNYLTGALCNDLPLKVTSPNGGEAWQKGTTRRIGWSWKTEAFVGQPFTIYLTPTDWSPTNPQLIIASGLVGTSYYDWNVGSVTNLVTPNQTMTPSQSYYVSVCANSKTDGKQVCDQSDSYFKIYDNGNVGIDLAVTSFSMDANGPKATLCNNGQAISTFPGWVSVNGLTVEFPNMSYLATTPGACNTHSWPGYSWPASTDGVYRAVIAVDPNGIYSETNELNNKLTATYNGGVPTTTPTSSLRIISPNGGEVLTKGQVYRIKWESSNLSSVYIKLRKNSVGDTVLGIVNTIPNQNYYDWVVPASLADGNDYVIRIIGGSPSLPVVSDDSDGIFTINNASIASSVQVLGPNGGESWTKGSTQTISWGATGAPEVSVYLVRDSDPTYRLAIKHNHMSGRANVIYWTVPGGDTEAGSHIADGSDYRIWVIGGGTTAVEDKSDAPFKIVSQ